MISKEDQKGLEELVRTGDTTVLPTLFDCYRERLTRLIELRIDPRLKSRFDATDVLQDSYVQAHLKIHQFVSDFHGSFYLWLRLVVGQMLSDLNRQHLGAAMRDAGREISLNSRAYPAVSSVTLAAQLIGRLTSATGAAIRAETRERVHAALNAMDPIDREVLTLRHFEMLTNDEVAQITGLTKTAASNRYVRALRRLGELIHYKSD